MTIQVNPDSTGKTVDTSSLVSGGVTLERVREVIADPQTVAALARVLNGVPDPADYGLVVRALIAALPLPAGASTEATLLALKAVAATEATLLLIAAAEAAGNVSLASLDTKTPALGQVLMAASTPVVLASDQDSINDRVARRNDEKMLIETMDIGSFALATRGARERVTLMDRRGRTTRGYSR